MPVGLFLFLFGGLFGALLLVRVVLRRRVARWATIDQARAYERAWAAVLPDLEITLNGKPATAATIAALKHLNSPSERQD